MKATELRIGNLVTVNNREFWPQLKDMPLSVYSITPNRSVKNDEWSYSIALISLNDRNNITIPLYAQMVDYIKPILLTDYWLKSLGFEQNKEYSVYGLINDFGRFSIWLDGRFKIETQDVNKKIYYVHELQNLYNSLTGNELALADA